MITKHSVEKIIVARPGIAVPNPGDKLFNGTTKAFNLGAGGFGVYVDEAGSGIPVGIDPNAYSGQMFRVIQRRNTANDNSPLYNKVLEQSQYIHGSCIGGITLGGEAGLKGANSAWLVGAPNAATTGKLPISSNNYYSMNVSASGWRVDMFGSIYSRPTIMGTFTSPNWLDSTITTENNRRDYTVKAIARDFNRKVQTGNLTYKMAAAMVLDTAGTTDGPTIASIIAGGANALVTIGYDKECTAVTLLVTEGILEAFTNLEAALTASTGNGGYGLGAGVVKLAPYKMPEDCTSGHLAGDGQDTADMIFVVALDEPLAYYDEAPATKRKLSVGMSTNSTLSTTKTVEVSYAREGAGQARNMRLWFEGNEQYKSYASSKNWGANHVAFPNELLDTEMYDIYTIEHCHTRRSNGAMPTTSPLLTVVALVRFENTASAYYNAGNPNPQKTYLESVLNAVGSKFGVPGPINL